MRRMAVTLVAWLCGAVLAHAQERADKVPVIGFLSPAPTQTVRDQLLRDALAKHGFVDGKSVRFEVRLAEGMPERLPGLARQFQDLGNCLLE